MSTKHESISRKIVLVCDYFQTGFGYQEFFLAKEFQALGLKVTVVCSDRYYPFPAYERTAKEVLGSRLRRIGFAQEAGVRVIRLPIWFEYGQGAVILLKKLPQTLAKLKPDIIVADGVFTPLAWQVARYKRRHPHPILIFDSHASTFNTQLYSTWLKRLYMLIYNYFLLPVIKRAAHHFTTVGESEYQMLKSELNLTKKNVSLIPLGADTRSFKRNNQLRFKMRSLLKIKPQQILLIYAGKVTPNKDLEILIEALANVNKQVNLVKLLILGQGAPDYIINLKQKIKFLHLADFIIWHPLVANQQLPAYYNAADIGIWPGNLSNTILEAMAVGLPVIVSKKISAQQTTNHLAQNQAALQMKRGSSSDLTKILMKLIDEPRFRSSRGHNCHQLIEQRFSWQQIAQQHLAVYYKN